MAVSLSGDLSDRERWGHKQPLKVGNLSVCGMGYGMILNGPANILTNRKALAIAGLVGLQAIAAIYFVFDALDDAAAEGEAFGSIMEFLVAFALLAGVVISAAHTRRLLAEARRRDQALSVAKGALGQLVQVRFREWGLSGAEQEVALFALKGCSAAEIAEMRGAAGGTVRSQLSQIYAKAGVTSQAMLVSLFFEDLLDGVIPPVPLVTATPAK